MVITSGMRSDGLGAAVDHEPSRERRDDIEHTFEKLRWDSPFGVTNSRWEAGEPVSQPAGITFVVRTTGDTLDDRR